MKWLKVHENAIEPQRKTEQAAGYDFYAAEDVRFLPHEVKVVPTGVSFEEMPEDMYLQLSLRSGTSLKRPFIMANGVGIIDSDYEWKNTEMDIGIILYNRSDRPALVDKGERIAQGILLKYHTIDDEVKPTEKRKGGRGSTGTK